MSQLALGKRANKALEEFRNASILDSEYAAAKYNLAMAHLVIRSREIGRWFEHVIDKFPDHPDAYFKLGAYHEAGTVLEKDPELARAAAAYQSQVNVNPDHTKAWFQLGSVLLQSGRPQEALPYLRALKQVKPEDPKVHLWTAFAHLRLGERTLSLRHLGV